MMALMYEFDATRKVSQNDDSLITSCWSYLAARLNVSQIAVGTRKSLTVRKHGLSAGTEGTAADDIAHGQSDAEDGTGSGGGAGSGAAASASAAAMKAKKRRVGGVNIFPGMRKVGEATTLTEFSCYSCRVQV
jgi:hypothetical protein